MLLMIYKLNIIIQEIKSFLFHSILKVAEWEYCFRKFYCFVLENETTVDGVILYVSVYIKNITIIY